MRGLSLFFCAVFLCAGSAQAAYKAGSVGYLYDSCRGALKDSPDAVTFDATYCGGFIEGYAAGVAATRVAIPPPAPQDPCAAEKTKEFARINNNFCANLPDYDNISLENINAIAPTAAGIFFRWIDFLRDQQTKGDALKSSVVPQLNAMVAEGNFCDALSADKNELNSLPPDADINPDLAHLNILSYVELQRSKTVQSEYEACAADLQASGGAHPFTATRCGGEISGFIAGALVMQNLQAGRPKTGDACEKEIDRLYRDLDASKTMCVSRDTNPATVAQIFLRQVDDARISGRGPSFGPGFGSAGYEPIYYGLLCDKK